MTPADIERRLTANLVYIAPEDEEVRRGKIIGAIRQIERIRDKAMRTEGAEEAIAILERLSKMVPEYKAMSCQDIRCVGCEMCKRCRMVNHPVLGGGICCSFCGCELEPR